MLLTEKEAAAYAKVSRKTIRRRINEGRLKAAQFGTLKRPMYRIDEADLKNVTAAKPVPAPPMRMRRRRRELVVAAGSKPWVFNDDLTG